MTFIFIVVWDFLMKSCVLNVNVRSIAMVSSILLSTCFHRKGRGRSAALIVTSGSQK